MAVNQTAGTKEARGQSMVFPIGAPNDGFARYFTGRSDQKQKSR